jgi:hypothetical protein
MATANLISNNQKFLKRGAKNTIALQSREKITKKPN